MPSQESVQTSAQSSRQDVDAGDKGESAHDRDAHVPPPLVVGPRARSAGVAMIAISIAGVLVAIAGVVIGWALVDAADRTLEAGIQISRDTIDVVDETLVVAADSLVVAETSVGDLSSSLSGADEALLRLASVVDSAGTVVGSDLPSILDTVGEVTPALARTANLIQSTLDGLAFLGVDATVDDGLVESLETLDRDLSDLSVRLGEDGALLDASSGDLEQFAADADELASGIETARDRLGDAQGLIDQYRTTTVQATDVLENARTDVANTTATTRLLILLFGIVFAAGQLIPFYFGSRLIAASRV